MNPNKKLSVFLIAVNLAGILCLLYCAVLYLSHSTGIANPDAMLPMEDWDRGGMLLTVGLLPMVAANTLGFLFVMKKSTPLTARFLFYLPSVLEIALVVHYWVYSLS